MHPGNRFHANNTSVSFMDSFRRGYTPSAYIIVFWYPFLSLTTVLCEHPYLVSLVFAVLQSLHLVTYLMLFITLAK